jgi:ubiquinone/menaquinone biosynthesis C-methylase UbiE
MTKKIDANNTYTQTQQAKYNQLAAHDAGGGRGFSDAILRAHNGHEDYKTFLWKDIPDLSSKDVLDFGCGPGRNLVFYANTFKSIDGVDLARQNLEMAYQWLAEEGFDVSKFKLFETNGVDLSNIPDESYDVVMSTICLQHISVHEIRYQLLEEFYRILRPNGFITVQLLLDSEKPGTVKYYDNLYDAGDTNGAHDCTVENPEYVKSDLEKIGFTNFHHYIRPSAELLGGKIGPMTDNNWLYVNAQKVV